MPKGPISKVLGTKKKQFSNLDTFHVLYDVPGGDTHMGELENHEQQLLGSF